MKKVLVLFAFLVVSSASFAQDGVKFENMTMKELMAKSAQDNKPIFLDVYASWCPSCKYMTNTIFPQKKTGDYFNAKFVNGKFDAEKGEGKEVARRYSVKSYPTFLILNSKGEEIGRVVGAADAEEFIKTVDANLKSATLKK